MADKDSFMDKFHHHHQDAAPPPPPPKQEAKPPEEHHHGKDFAKKAGNAVTFGAGATAGSDAVNAIIKNV